MHFKKSITNLVDKLNYDLGVKLFSNGNLFSYNLFNFFLRKNICNKKYLNDQRVFSYFNNGFAKLDPVNIDNINDLNIFLKKYNSNIFPRKDCTYVYSINNEIFTQVKKIINFDILDSIKIFEKFYNLKIILADIKIQRNYSAPKNEEVYSNFFHCDGYTYNLFKVFINLEDVDEDQGPLTLVKKDKVKYFFKLSNYKNRNTYNDNDPSIRDCLYKNIGKKGEVFLCNTTELLHRAGDVSSGKFRDMLFLEFIAYPFDSKINIFSFENEIHDKILDKKFAKIEGFRNLIKLYWLCKQNKLDKENFN